MTTATATRPPSNFNPGSSATTTHSGTSTSTKTAGGATTSYNLNQQGSSSTKSGATSSSSSRVNSLIERFERNSRSQIANAKNYSGIPASRKSVDLGRLGSFRTRSGTDSHCFPTTFGVHHPLSGGGGPAAHSQAASALHQLSRYGNFGNTRGVDQHLREYHGSAHAGVADHRQGHQFDSERESNCSPGLGNGFADLTQHPQQQLVKTSSPLDGNRSLFSSAGTDSGSSALEKRLADLERKHALQLLQERDRFADLEKKLAEERQQHAARIKVEQSQFADRVAELSKILAEKDQALAQWKLSNSYANYRSKNAQLHHTPNNSSSTSSNFASPLSSPITTATTSGAIAGAALGSLGLGAQQHLQAASAVTSQVQLSPSQQQEQQPQPFLFSSSLASSSPAANSGTARISHKGRNSASKNPFAEQGVSSSSSRDKLVLHDDESSSRQVYSSEPTSTTAGLVLSTAQQNQVEVTTSSHSPGAGVTSKNTSMRSQLHNFGTGTAAAAGTTGNNRSSASSSKITSPDDASNPAGIMMRNSNNVNYNPATTSSEEDPAGGAYAGELAELRRRLEIKDQEVQKLKKENKQRAADVYTLSERQVAETESAEQLRQHLNALQAEVKSLRKIETQYEQQLYNVVQENKEYALSAKNHERQIEEMAAGKETVTRERDALVAQVNHMKTRERSQQQKSSSSSTGSNYNRASPEHQHMDHRGGSPPLGPSRASGDETTVRRGRETVQDDEDEELRTSSSSSASSSEVESQDRTDEENLNSQTTESQQSSEQEGRKSGSSATSILGGLFSFGGSSSSTSTSRNRAGSGASTGLFGGTSSLSPEKRNHKTSRFSPKSRLSTVDENAKLVSDLQAEVHRKTEEVTKQKRTVSNLTLELENAHGQISVIQVQNEEIDEIRKQNEKLLSEVKLARSKMNASQMSVLPLEEENEELRRRCAKAEAKWEEMEKEKKTLKQELQQSQFARNEALAQLKTMEKSLESLHGEVEYWKTKASEEVGAAGKKRSKASNISTSSEHLAGDDQAQSLNSPQASTIARIQHEREQLMTKLDQLNKQQEDAQNALDKDRLIGDSMWLRDLPVASSARDTQQGSSSKPKFKHEFKVANLLEGEELQEEHDKDELRAANGAGHNVGSSASSSSSSLNKLSGISPTRNYAGGATTANGTTSGTAGHTSSSRSPNGGGGASSSSASKRSGSTTTADHPTTTEPETEEIKQLKKQAFRAVGQDDEQTLKQILKQVGDCKIWLAWVNGGGDTLLKMADVRKRDKTLHLLRKSMGVAELVSNERQLQEKDNVWVFRELGDPQPEQATVKGVMPSETGDPKDSLIWVQYWSNKTKDEYIPAVRCRLMLNNSWELDQL
ncbi:unnamed protein product [Amoebophrya sp. A120]|nr:unnamed protein product [Amoebophrya sp. A120]|eukprot:GSA120T00014827001.1